jgi:hypothetical protein
MFAGPLALIVLVSAAARADYVAVWTIGPAVLFFISDSLPIPAAEEIQGVIGIATFAVVALRLLRLEADSRHAMPEPIGLLATAV